MLDGTPCFDCQCAPSGICIFHSQVQTTYKPTTPRPDLLTPEERLHVEEIRHWATGTRFLAIIDRLAPPPVTP